LVPDKADVTVSVMIGGIRALIMALMFANSLFAFARLPEIIQRSDLLSTY